jgi:diguanylate cyclase (GGDEF)-like protein
MPSGERSALDVILRCFVGEVGGTSGLVVARNGGPDTRVLAIWGVAGAQPRASWAHNSLLGRTFDSSRTQIEARRFAPANGSGHNGVATLAGRAASSVAAPITSSAGPLGAIYAEFAGPPPMSADDLRWIADSYARLAGMCMSGGEGLSAALIDSHRDRLTGCLNHGGLLDVLGTEIERARRERHRLSCCCIDLDGFKAINDRDGHLAGNRVLAATGNALNTGRRPYDAVGRFGGDEFVVILPYSGTSAAKHMVQRMRIRIGTQVTASTGTPVFVSAGIAEWRRGDTALDVLDAADRALIDAKQTGGARVSASSLKRNRGLAERTRGLVRDRGAGARRAAR